MDENPAAEARSAPLPQQAVRLASWLGDEARPVTPGGVVRKPDVPAACAVLGITAPARLRGAADVRELRRPWAFGVGAGLIRVACGKATPGPDIGGMGDDELLNRWLVGARAVFSGETRKNHEDGVLIAALTVLALLDGESIVPELPSSMPFWQRAGMSAYFVAMRYGRQASNVQLEPDILLPLLTGLGLVVTDEEDLRITALGRWMRPGLAGDLPAAADPPLPAATMIAAAARFDEESRAHVVSDWLDARKPGAAVREILTAAAAMSASERIVAIAIARAAGDDAVGAWREAAGTPVVGPHATETLWEWGEIEDVPDADGHWLAVERAAAAGENADEALTALVVELPGSTTEECLELAAATGHAEAEAVLENVAGFLASGARPAIDTVYQLKVTLAGYAPATWRSVQMPAVATLEDLHYAIQTLFGWDGDHLYVFRVGKRNYSGVFGHLEETGYDYQVRLGAALSEARKFGYTYDLGACWDHEITLEKTLPFEDGQYPACVAFSGANPVEYPAWDEDAGEYVDEDPEPFDIDDVNRRLAGADDEGGALQERA